MQPNNRMSSCSLEVLHALEKLSKNKIANQMQPMVCLLSGRERQLFIFYNSSSVRVNINANGAGENWNFTIAESLKNEGPRDDGCFFSALL